MIKTGGKYRDYLDHYQRQSDQGAFISIDNGAFETGECANPHDMLALSDMLHAKEIALSDYLGDYKRTVRRAKEALDVYRNHVDYLVARDIRIMLIPHGQTIYEWGQCMWDLIHLHRAYIGSERRFTIGIPKMYEKWAGGRMNLLDRFVLGAFRQYPCDVHLLGIEGPLTNLSSIAQRHPWVRSTDSAKPFTFAMGGIIVNGEYGSLEMEMNPGRPEDYFTRTMSAHELNLAHHNAQIFQIRAMAVGTV